MNKLQYMYIILFYILLNSCTNSNYEDGLKIDIEGELMSPIIQEGGILNNSKINGYRGIWFELMQKSTYGDKYSGGLGTYTACHKPIAIYSEEVNRTFFVYGGTTQENERHLLCMIGCFDHNTDSLQKPTVVFDKGVVNDPHDNPSLAIDNDGFIWVFVSGRALERPGFICRSEAPYNIEKFVELKKTEFTYPQPCIFEDNSITLLYTKYRNIRELYCRRFNTERFYENEVKLACIIAPDESTGGHYQVSSTHNDKIGTFFNRHPNGNPDLRTDLYYMQSSDKGETWTTVTGTKIKLPITNVDSPTRVFDYKSLGKNVYINDVCFDYQGNPVCLFITSNGALPGPINGPYEWKLAHWSGEKWIFRDLFQSDHNYDMGSLFIHGTNWTIVAPTITGKFPYSTGGEIAIWSSIDSGKSWVLDKQLTRESPGNHSFVRSVQNGRSPFCYLWADGNPNQFSISKLYYGNLDGEIFEMPYKMNSNE